MKRHWKLWLGLALLVACCCVGLVVVEPYFHEPVRAYHRLKLGMTRAEVEEVIGKPPVDLSPAPFYIDFMPQIRESGIPRSKLYSVVGCRIAVWTWPDYQVGVAYDQSDSVVGYYLVELDRPKLLDRLRTYLGF